MLVTLYDEEFYRSILEGSVSSAQVVVPILHELIEPKSVLDVGCGSGAWLRVWRILGPQTHGIDGEYALDSLVIPEERFTAVDLTRPWSVLQQYDAVLCLEVAEHLPVRGARGFISALCAHSEVVVFSAAVPGQGGTGHINEKPLSYWAKIFARLGYKPYDLVRDEIWWDQRVDWWYRQNIVIFATDKAARKRYWTPVDRELDLAQPALLMPELQRRVAATVCIPWRPTPSRRPAYKRVREFWEMFGWPVVTADSETEVFSLAQARNNAVRKAKTDVVVIADADTLIDPLNVIRAAAEPQGVCWPFTQYRILPKSALDVPLSELVDVPHINSWDGDGVMGVGGCLITTRDEYWRLGGQPPEFIGWGWEDTAFTMIVATLSRAKRLAGRAYSFEHNRNAEKYLGAKADSPGWDRDIERNEELANKYRAAQGRAWLMREVIKQREDQ